MEYRYDENGEPVYACEADTRIRWRDADWGKHEDAGLWLTCDNCQFEMFAGTLHPDDRLHMNFLRGCEKDHDFNHNSFFRPRINRVA